MSYTRVIPRDLYNEADLLKCLGRLALLINDGLAPKGLEFDHTEEDGPFQIVMDSSDGSLRCENLVLVNKSKERITPHRNLNDRDPWPLYIFTYEDEISVFDKEGNLTPEFTRWAKGKRSRQPFGK